MGISSGPKLSGLQKQVLSLYRSFLRAARSKSAEDRRQMESVVAAEFRRNAKQIDRKNFIHIEYLLRRVTINFGKQSKSVVESLKCLKMWTMDFSSFVRLSEILSDIRFCD
ncbi:succinate dehydrogenase assembly factor 1, mitochondrial-like [Cucurbita moschata]|uniref:Succinate dehydrogenase assembly factor 1, mitochondrial-like n=1 Tax=Cucurbita moschata TaxID=3662 RepID=A0A6J1EHV2_CUCMO|nr:succinate dehydrogenase assembly factor 1, mitochondrial-like [Cucurbita moschata]